MFSKSIMGIWGQVPIDIEQFSAYLRLFYYVLIVVVTATILYTLLEWFTMDRAIKLFNNKNVYVFIGNKGYYGVLHAPPRGGGSFEIFFKDKNIENPLSLLMFLIENYEETGKTKFMFEAKKLLAEFKKMGIVDKNIEIEDLKKGYNPWASPSLVSKKVFKERLSDLYAIICFRYMLSRRELRERWRELERLYHPSMFSRIVRSTYNILSLVKDRLSQALMRSATPILSNISPELKSTLEDFQKKTTQIQTTYHPLLENSIGRLINVRVNDVEGELKIYQGVLREYSNNYIVVYDVDYKIQMRTLFKDVKEVEGFPKPFLETHGLDIKTGKHISLRYIDDKQVIVLNNISNEPIHVEKVNVGDKDYTVEKILYGGEELSIDIDEYPSYVEVNYEISREADIIWPRSKIEVIGLGDYPAKLLENILMRKL